MNLKDALLVIVSVMFFAVILIVFNAVPNFLR